LGRTQQRIEWLDLAKAGCILLVILCHVQMYSTLVPWRTPAVTEGWNEIVALARPFRMPLFFLVSGILASRLLDRAWSEGGRQRAAHLFFAYAIWAVIVAAATALILGKSLPHPGRFLLSLVSGSTETWYLWALPTYLFIAWATRKLPWWIPIGLALVVAATAPWASERAYRSILRCLPLFLAGTRLSGPILACAAAATPRRLAAAALLFAIAYGARRAVPSLPQPATDAAAVLVAILAIPLAARRWPRLLPPAQWLAARTLPLYVLHFPLVALLSLMARRLTSPAMAQSPLFAAVYPLLMTAAVASLCLLLHRLLLGGGFGWLFDPPMKSPARPSQPALSAS
jgi:uncharacterized membrane protein YcfT